VRGLHPARARRLERPERRIEPHVDAGDELEGNVHVVARQKCDGNPALELVTVSKYPLNEPLSVIVVRVRLACVDDLQPALFADFKQPVDIVKSR
jgi:hypothetical protein